MPTVRKSIRKKAEPKSARRATSKVKPTNGKRLTPPTNHQEEVTPTPTRPMSRREQLEQERLHLSAELARLRAELQEAPGATGDEIDLSVYEREKTLGLVSAYEHRLEEIAYALRAAEKGAYGICERCGKPIDPARLEIFPEATLCVSCKNDVERLAKRGLL